MARGLKNLTNYDNTDPGNYPDGRVRDNTGSNEGTEVSEKSYGDIHQFFAYLMRNANMQYNGQPDNVANKFQLVEALRIFANKNDIINNASTTANANEFYFDTDLSVLKTGETMIFTSANNSTTAMNLAKCSNNAYSKTLAIKGKFVAGQKIRLLNKANVIEVSGIYETDVISNLVNDIADIKAEQVKANKINAVFQSNGAMVFWNKPANEIPAGWQEVVNWRGRFPVGMDVSDTDFATLGKLGGEKAHVLIAAELPKLEGTWQSLEANSFGNSGIVATQSTDSASNIGGGGNPPFSHKTKKVSFGADTAHNNLPPYRTVLFIEYVG